MARNYRARQGELDIVASKGKVVCYVEVKTRRVRDAYHSVYRVQDSMNRRKEVRIHSLARTYQKRHQPLFRRRRLFGGERFDLITVELKGGLVLSRAKLSHFSGYF